jgi:N-acetylglucosaminyldiphosphoundecaprenol N-acetyl-beta-D-mannosaminyltransferase
MFAGSGSSIFLLGGAPQIADISAANLSKLYPGLKIAGTHDGYFTPDDEPAILKLISDAKPDALFVGLDMPRQELWIARNVQKLKASVVIGVGGSFDVISGKLKRAPEWMRALHIEWLFRLFLQPWRVKRMAGLPCFVFNVIRLKHIKATT